jgi:hypothetical protein
MDAMAITGHFTKPHLFVTATSNPNWPEIHRELLTTNGPTVLDNPRVQAQEAADA